MYFYTLKFMIDFHKTQFALIDGKLSKEELFEQIVNLPCFYTLLEDAKNIFYLELEYQEDQNKTLNVLPIYSSLDLSLKALEELNVLPMKNKKESLILQWQNIQEIMELFESLNIDAISFDLLMNKEGELEGLVLEKDNIIKDFREYILQE